VALYLTVSAGPRADEAKPVLALGDQRLIRRMLALVPRALDAEPANERGVVLPLVRREQGA
jgi:hypothetical protein